MWPEQRCKQCGRSFRAHPSRDQKYCSMECAYASPERVVHVKPKVREPIVCAGCGITFTPTTTGGKKYCSHPCATKSIGLRTMGDNRAVVKRSKFIKKNCLFCDKVFRSWMSSNRVYCDNKCSSSDPVRKTAAVTTMRANGTTPKFSRARARWVILGGQRIFCRSSWEAKYAHYLEWLKGRGEILKWEHEPHTFWFEKIKRGVRSYLPDFRVTHAGGSTEWHEVKGWMDKKSKTKIKRMAKYYPYETLLLRDSAWFKTANRQFTGIVPGWDERTRKHALRSNT